MTDIVIPDSIVEQARVESPTRGARKMEILSAYAANSVPDGEEIVDWKRDEEGRLIAVTAPIPTE